MVCTFFGHRNATEAVREPLKKSILHLLKHEHVDMFLVGNDGSFDFYVQCILREMKEVQKGVHFQIVLSRPDEKSLSGNQMATIFPEGLEKALPRFAISKRNEWLLKKSSFVIAYVKHSFSNSDKWIKRAVKKGIQIINLANFSDFTAS